MGLLWVPSFSTMNLCIHGSALGPSEGTISFCKMKLWTEVFSVCMYIYTYFYSLLWVPSFSTMNLCIHGSALGPSEGTISFCKMKLWTEVFFLVSV